MTLAGIHAEIYYKVSPEGSFKTALLTDCKGSNYAGCGSASIGLSLLYVLSQLPSMSYAISAASVVITPLVLFYLNEISLLR